MTHSSQKCGKSVPVTVLRNRTSLVAVGPTQNPFSFSQYYLPNPTTVTDKLMWTLLGTLLFIILSVPVLRFFAFSHNGNMVQTNTEVPSNETPFGLDTKCIVKVPKPYYLENNNP